MITIYHFVLCPLSRLLRFLLSEIELDFKLISINPWKDGETLSELNPRGELPVLKYEKSLIVDSASISEFILEKHNKIDCLLGQTPETRQKTRSITNYMNSTVFYGSISTLLHERVAKFFENNMPPNSNTLRIAKTKAQQYIEYIECMIKANNYIAGNSFSLADITTSAHISVMDYFGDIQWERNTALREWYALMKSRKSFKSILHDELQGFPPPKYYSKIDF